MRPSPRPDPGLPVGYARASSAPPRDVDGFLGCRAAWRGVTRGDPMRHAEPGPTLPAPDDETGYGGARGPAGPRDSGPRLDLRAVLADGPGLGEEDLLDLYCNDQVDRWCEGERIPAETYLTLHPALTID